MFLSIIIKSMCSNALILVTLAKWVHKDFEKVAEEVLIQEYLFNISWQKFCLIEYRKPLKVTHYIFQDLFWWANNALGKNWI